MDSPLFHGETVSTTRIIYTASDFAKKSLLYLQETGFLQAVKIHESKRTALASFLFFVVLSGSGQFWYQGKSRTLAPGDCVFVNCRNGYFHKTSSDFWSLKWVHFNGFSAEEIYQKYIERSGENVFRSANPEKYSRIIDSIISIAGSKDYIRDVELNERLSLLITEIMRESVTADAKSRKRNSNLEGIKNYLELNFSTKITLDSLSESFYINKYYLTRIFKASYGITIDQYLLHQRITKAKELLRFTSLTISEISQKVGFKDQNYFSRVFKAIEKQAPREYRKGW